MFHVAITPGSDAGLMQPSVKSVPLTAVQAGADFAFLMEPPLEPLDVASEIPVVLTEDELLAGLEVVSAEPELPPAEPADMPPEIFAATVFTGSAEIPSTPLPAESAEPEEYVSPRSAVSASPPAVAFFAAALPAMPREVVPDLAASDPLAAVPSAVPVSSIAAAQSKAGLQPQDQVAGTALKSQVNEAPDGPVEKPPSPVSSADKRSERRNADLAPLQSLHVLNGKAPPAPTGDAPQVIMGVQRQLPEAVLPTFQFPYSAPIMETVTAAPSPPAAGTLLSAAIVQPVIATWSSATEPIAPSGEGLLSLTGGIGLAAPPANVQPNEVHSPRLHAPPATPAAQVVAVLRDMAEGQTELSLDPVELGRVRIVLRVEGDRAHVHMYAERPETLEILRRSSPELTAGLEADGFEASQFLFSRDERSQKDENTPVAETFTMTSAAGQQRHIQVRVDQAGLDLRL